MVTEKEASNLNNTIAEILQICENVYANMQRNTSRRHNSGSNCRQLFVDTAKTVQLHRFCCSCGRNERALQQKLMKTKEKARK